MRKYFSLALLVIISLSSCGRRMAPTLSREEGIKNYDTAAFDYFYVEAVKQKLMGNAGDALSCLEQCIKLNPESDGAYYQMAQIVIASGNVVEGKRYLKKALELDNKNLYYMVMLAGIYYQEKDLDSAIIYYDKASKVFPDKENLLLTLGSLYSEKKDYNKAISIFDSLDERYGINESSTIAAIKNLMMAERFDEALVKTELMIKNFPDEILYQGLLAEIYRGKGENDKALEIYDSIIEKNPDDPQAQLALCDFLITQKSYEELFRFLSTLSLNDKVSKEDKISLMARLLDIPELTNDPQDHLMLAFMVLEANYPQDDIFMLLRPELLIKQNKLNEAATRLEEIIKLRPGNYYAWEKLLLIYLQTKDYNSLFNKGEECASLFNRSFLAKILYANGAVETGKYSVALEELKKAEILAGESKDSLMQVLTMRADVYYRMKEYRKSFEIFDQILKSNKEDLTVLNNYAYYLSEQNMDLKEAEKMAKKVIDTENNNTTYLDTYGWVLYKRGKFKDAAKVFEKIINMGQEPDAVWYEHYGYILKAQNKCSNAIEMWKIAIKVDSTKSNLINEIANCEK